ncbi:MULTISPECIES: hypothetical protein [unclassified Kitasatospora]|uniref:hypothetical protein n=1 Tax=unclassified Kitasatospora TaxID=2633591 RepID=UPI000A85451C|nr:MULTISPECIES: hypothetical protein [unclassified Kitasatospora]
MDPDCAVKVMEGVASVLKGLPSEQLERLLLAIEGLTETETDPERREFLEAFPYACGLIEVA